MTQRIAGRKPVLEALKGNRQIDEIIVKNKASASLQEIIDISCKRNIPCRCEDKNELDRLSGGRLHQGVIAKVSEFEYCSVDDIIKKAESRDEEPFIIIADGIEDPHNLGAIMRTAECAGAHGVIIPKRRAVSVNETVTKTSAGAAEHILCARVTNIGKEIDKLKRRGIWIACCDMDGTNYCECDLKGPVALVIGGEGRGVSRLVKEKCDIVASIPMKGRISSLNASNAAAVLIYEILRQRG